MKTKHLCILLCCFSLAGGICAEVSNDYSSLAQFAVSRSEENPAYWIALTSTYRCAFRPPANWTVTQEGSRRALRFQDPVSRSVLTLRFQDGSVRISSKEEVTQWLQELLTQYPRARLQQKSEVAALTRGALVLDLSWTSADSVRRTGRFARVPVPGGHLELSLLASTGPDFDSAASAMTQFLTSLQCSAPTQQLAVKALPVE